MRFVFRNIRLKWLLVLSLLFNLVAVFFVAKRIYWTYWPHADNSKQEIYASNQIHYWLGRDKLFDVLPVDKNEIVFLGNSLTQQFELAELFKNLNVKNRGINGDIIEGVIRRISPIIKSQPKKIFIEIGINDFAKGLKEDSIFTAYTKLVDTLLVSCKSTRIYIQSLFPVADSCEMLHNTCNSQVNSQIKRLNEELEEYSKERHVEFINLYPYFVEDGQLNPKYSVDGIHLTAEGYFLWRDLVKPFLDDQKGTKTKELG
jgi:lysophospholipase L1-like esterase